MGYAARASNGESPRELTDRKFKHVAAVTIDRHAGAIGQLVEAINITNQQATAAREFIADLSVRLDQQHQRLAVLEHDLQILREHYTDMRRAWVPFLGRLRWLLTGK